MPDSVSFRSTAVKSKSVTLFTQAKQFLVISLYSSSCFSCFFCCTTWLFFVVFFSWRVQLLETCSMCRAVIPFPWSILVICHPCFQYTRKPCTGWLENGHRDRWWWWWWRWRHCIRDLTCSWQGLHLDNKLQLHQTNFHWFSCQQLLASALSQDTACFGLCACWS